MAKLILVSFADTRYRNAQKRLNAYTSQFPFTERFFLNETNTFSEAYWKKLKPWLYRRGYGYWEWKAKVIQEYLNKVNDGDIVIWSDVGVFWNSSEKALERFSEYIKMLDKTDVLVFQEPCIEQEWTKGDVLEKLRIYDDESICTSFQLWSGCFFLKKSPLTLKLVDEWAKLNLRINELVTDKRSKVPNKPGFKEHRHDQSSFSILVKKTPHIEISHKEVEAAEDVNKNWDKLSSYPIQARRLKWYGKPLSERIKNKLLCPWRLFLHLYFKYYRSYDYNGHYSW